MSTYYTTYLIPGRNITSPETIIESIKNETAVYLRWDFAKETPISLIDADKDYLKEDNTIIYIYMTDDTVTPFHTDDEFKIKTLKTLNSKDLVYVFETASIDNGTIAAFKIDAPVFLHDQVKQSKIKFV